MANGFKLAMVAAMLAVAVAAQNRTIVKDQAYNRMATIKGHIEFVGNSGSEKLVAAGQFVIFQREKLC